MRTHRCFLALGVILGLVWCAGMAPEASAQYFKKKYQSYGYQGYYGPGYYDKYYPSVGVYYYQQPYPYYSAPVQFYEQPGYSYSYTPPYQTYYYNQPPAYQSYYYQPQVVQQTPKVIPADELPKLPLIVLNPPNPEPKEPIKPVTNPPNSEPKEPIKPATNPPPPAVPAVNVAIGDNMFNPSQLEVKVGTTVRWTNNGTNKHNITSANLTTASPQDTFKSQDLGNGESFSFTFTKPGTYVYRCTIHPNMTGTIVVK
jgi:plastocyanin